MEVRLLVIASAVAIKATVDLSRVTRLLSSPRIQGVETPDWLEDAITVAKRESKCGSTAICVGEVRG